MEDYLNVILKKINRTDFPIILNFETATFGNKEQLRKFLNRKSTTLIKQTIPEYHNYIARDFSAISRLIRTKINSKHYDIYEVKDWLGHTQIQTTMSYIKDAKDYYKLAHYDWINHTLKTKRGESAKKSTKPKIGLCCLKSLRERSGLEGIRTPDQSVKSRLLFLAELQAQRRDYME